MVAPTKRQTFDNVPEGAAPDATNTATSGDAIVAPTIAGGATAVVKASAAIRGLKGLEVNGVAGTSVYNVGLSVTPGASLSSQVYFEVDSTKYPTGQAWVVDRHRNTANATTVTAQLSTTGVFQVLPASGSGHNANGNVPLPNGWYVCNLRSTKGTTTANGRIYMTLRKASDDSVVGTAWDSGAVVNTGTADMGVAQTAKVTGGTGLVNARIDEFAILANSTAEIDRVAAGAPTFGATTVAPLTNIEIEAPAPSVTAATSATGGGPAAITMQAHAPVVVGYPGPPAALMTIQAHAPLVTADVIPPTFPWVTPTLTVPWCSPRTTGKLGTLHLIGDVQTYWEQVWPTLRPNTVYDVLGIDVRDRLVMDKDPDSLLIMGDCSDYIAPSLEVLHQRLDLMREWVQFYGLDYGKYPLYVAGNHDLVGWPGQPAMMTAEDYAAYMGYAAPNHVRDFGDYRVIVLTPTGTGAEMPPGGPTGPVPVRPMSDADISWLDSQLTADSRPTLIANHAPISGMVTSGITPEEDDLPGWGATQATVTGGTAATDLKALLDDHGHVAAWLHGHTHSNWNATPDNVSTFNTGSRQISVVDASRVFQRPRFNDRSTVVTFYLDLLDDGKTIEIHWRDHDKALWSTADRSARMWSGTAT